VIKIALSCFALLAIDAARGQESPTDGRVILYELDRAQGKYVLSMNFESREEGRSSFVVIGDTFSVRPRVNPHGVFCDVIMSNTYVLHTKFGSSPSNDVVQTQTWTDGYIIPFPEHTKIVFNHSVVELPKWKNEASASTNRMIYEGDDALRQLKKMGTEPPPDMDTNKTGGSSNTKQSPLIKYQ
jgi:hypothetical protein